MKYYDTERCQFDDEIDPDELCESIISEVESNFTESINWRKAKLVLDYIRESVDGNVSSDEIVESACHQLEELGY